MKRILSIQNISCEPLGSFEEEAGPDAEFTYVRPFAGDSVPPSTTSYDGLIVLGGPMAVYEADAHESLGRELDLIRSAIEDDFPVLGICLGSQLIAAAAGAPVYAGPQRETGWGSVYLTDAARNDDLFSGLPSPLPVFQLHGDTFDLPGGAVLLATNDAYSNQAFRVGRCVYGLQFHVEITSRLAKDWSGIYRDYILGSGKDPQNMVRDVESRSQRLRPIAAQIISRFLQLH